MKGPFDTMKADRWGFVLDWWINAAEHAQGSLGRKTFKRALPDALKMESAPSVAAVLSIMWVIQRDIPANFVAEDATAAVNTKHEHNRRLCNID